MAAHTGPQLAIVGPTSGYAVTDPSGEITINVWPDHAEIHHPPHLTRDHTYWIRLWLGRQPPAWRIKHIAYTRDGLVTIVTVGPPA